MTMSILLLGLNHRTAPVEVRERLAFSREGAANALMLFAKSFPGAEAVIISTCNRVEILVNTENGSPDGAGAVVEFLSRARNIPAERFAPYLYQLDHAGSVRHLFRVISGLDSIVVGECQIVNQVKQAYALAHEQGTCGPVLHRLFHHAFGVSKRTRGETRIADGKLSVPSVAMDIVRRACPHPSSLKVLVVGAGDMAQHACRYLSQAAVAKLVVTSRTYNNARALADACGGAAVPYADLDRHLATADVVITATSCPTAILTEQRLRQATACRESQSPLVLIDLSVPRNIEPTAGRIQGVTLYDIDSLVDVVRKTSRGRARAVGAAEAIIDEEVAAFDRWINDMRVAPLIGQIYRDVRALAEVEVRRLFNRCPDLSSDHQDEVTQLVDRLVGKLLHPCVSAIRQGTSPPATHIRGVFEGQAIAVAGAPELEQYA
jgi:glutamyl-tRNA reductase